MKILWTIVFAIIVSPSFAVSQPIVKCSVDKVVIAERKKNVPVTILKGAEIVKTNEVFFEGQKFSVIWNKSDKFETQTRLTMKFNDFESSIYNFETKLPTGPINIITNGDLRFQCWTE